MKKIKLPNALTIALGQYFMSRALATPHQIGANWNGNEKSVTFSEARNWNKDLCLERITSSLPKGWGYQACAGTFWIYKAGNKKTHYYTHEEIWPLAEVRPNKT